MPIRDKIKQKVKDKLQQVLKDRGLVVDKPHATSYLPDDIKDRMSPGAVAGEYYNFAVITGGETGPTGDQGAFALANGKSGDIKRFPLPQDAADPRAVFVPNGHAGILKSIGPESKIVQIPDHGIWHFRKEDVQDLKPSDQRAHPLKEWMKRDLAVPLPKPVEVTPETAPLVEDLYDPNMPPRKGVIVRAARDPNRLMERIRENLSEDLLHPRFKKERPADAPCSWGHCYAAAEALYHLLGGSQSGYKPMALSVKDAPDHGPHWFLVGPKGEVIDPTHDQFDSPPPYELARGKGFLTREPSARARELMSRSKKRKQAKKSPLDGPQDQTGLRLGLLGKVRGLDVVLVNGTIIRDEVDVDFTMGGNSARYGYVNPGEIWVEKALDDEDRAATIVHEVAEYHRMTKRHETYEEAHERASELETMFRSELVEGEVERSNPVDLAIEFLARAEDERDVELGKFKNKAPRKERASVHVTAAGLVDLKGLDSKLARQLAELTVQVMKATAFDMKNMPNSVKAQKKLDEDLMAIADVVVSEFGETHVATEKAEPMLRSREAESLFDRIIVVAEATYSVKPSAKGWFGKGRRGPEIGVAVYTIVKSIVGSRRIVPPLKLLTEQFQLTLAHELRHAADWAYQESAKPGAWKKQNPFPATEDPDYWPKYMNLPSELKSWASNVAIEVWRRWGPSYKDLSGKDLISTISTISPEVMAKVAPENRKEFLQRVTQEIGRLEERERVTKVRSP